MCAVGWAVNQALAGGADRYIYSSFISGGELVPTDFKMDGGGEQETLPKLMTAFREY